MSQRILRVYRVLEVSEYFVDDDGIYEDDVDMLRDVVDAAKGGVLEFGATDAEFVVMVWDEDSKLVVRAVVPEGSPEATSSGTSSKVTEFCPRCLEPQFEAASGATCQRGHGGLPGISRRERDEKAEARRELQAECGAIAPPAPVPVPVRRTTRRRPRERNSK